MKNSLLFILFLTLAPFSYGAGELITYEVDGQAYEGYYVNPNQSKGMVLLIHDWDGLTDYEIKRSDMLADLGYSVFAADLFGKGVRPTEVKDKRQHTGELYQDRQKMRTLMNAALKVAYEKGASASHTMAMGYCFGGAAVLELARSGADLKGFASFHGGLKTPPGQDYANANGKVMVYHGTADAHITMQEFADLANELEQHEVPHEMITYSGAPHAFTVFDSDRYQEQADQQSWKSFTSFLGDLF